MHYREQRRCAVSLDGFPVDTCWRKDRLTFPSLFHRFHLSRDRSRESDVLRIYSICDSNGSSDAIGSNNEDKC